MALPCKSSAPQMPMIFVGLCPTHAIRSFDIRAKTLQAVFLPRLSMTLSNKKRLLLHTNNTCNKSLASFTDRMVYLLGQRPGAKATVMTNTANGSPRKLLPLILENILSHHIAKSKEKSILPSYSMIHFFQNHTMRLFFVCIFFSFDFFGKIVKNKKTPPKEDA